MWKLYPRTDERACDRAKAGGRRRVVMLRLSSLRNGEIPADEVRRVSPGSEKMVAWSRDYPIQNTCSPS